MRKKWTGFASLLLVVTLISQTYSVYASTYQATAGMETLSSISHDVYAQIQTDVVTHQVYQPTSEKTRKLLQEDPELLGEVVEKRTPTSKHFLRKDGTYKAIITMQDQHYEAEDGKLYDIDTSIYKESVLDSVYARLSKASAQSIKELAATNKAIRLKGVLPQEEHYKAPQVPFDATLPNRFVQGYSIAKNNERLSFVPVGASNVTGTVYEHSGMQYENAWNQTDVLLQVVDNGIKETLILKSPDAPHTFSYEVTGALNESLSNEFALQPAWLIDASGVYRDVNQSIRRDGNRAFIDVLYDSIDLAYPIMIDPTVTIASNSIQQSAQVSNDNYYNPTRGNTSSFVAGREMPGDDGELYTYRGLVQYNISSIPAGAAIRNATLYLYGRENYYVYPIYKTQVYRVAQPWNQNAITWNNQPQFDGSWSSSATGTPQLFAESYFSWDITNPVSQWHNGISPNYGLAFINEFPHHNGLYSFGSYSLYNLSGSNLGYITVDYNDAPSVPTVLTPTSGSILDGIQSINWSAASDVDTPPYQIRYHVQLSTNGGASWNDIVSLTNPGVTSYNFDFTNQPETTNAYVRVRALDTGVGAMYGNWGQSAPFTIRHNRAPNAPSGTYPGSGNSATPQLIVGGTPTLNWIFTDPDAGNTQSAYNIVIKNGANPIYDSGWVGSSGTSFIVPGGIMAPNVTYNWQVSVQDNKGAISPYSAPSYFKINSIPTLAITSYSDGQQVTNNILTFSWNYGDLDGQAQTAYQVVGTQDNWNTWAYNSGEVNSSANSHVAPPLAFGGWSFAVRVFDGMEWSNWVFRSNISIVYLDTEPPTTPSNISMTARSENSITLTWNASTDNKGVVSYDIYDSSMWIGSSPTNTITLSNVPLGHAYVITIKAKDPTGNVSSSSEVFYYTHIFGPQKYYYDSAGKVDYILFPNGRKIDYQYDANGNLIGTTLHLPN
ncbi:DNRLRE domain-containing protein [Paenibacillus ginsengarvi]|uniref:DNRLRE domain-containing protein n=1 Tax=Paenibacillus ginsengarvi TaxID=400777 RepID=UPI00131572DF|nr:DNRLRE domain-containing protein [Paenibacillus ginsengarvi]